MSWVRQSRDSSDDSWLKAFKKRSRFLIDEDVDPIVAEYLRDHRLNTRTVADLGMRGADDRLVFQRAWKEARILVAHNKRDFYDNDLAFPIDKTAGVLVLDNQDVQSIWQARYFMGKWAEVWVGVKVCFGSGHEIKRKTRELRGRVVERRYWFNNNLELFEWVDE